MSQKRMNEETQSSEKKPCIDWFERVPQEVLEVILSYIECADISRARVVCMRFRVTLQSTKIACNIFSASAASWTEHSYLLRICSEFMMFPHVTQDAILKQLSDTSADRLRQATNNMVPVWSFGAVRNTNVEKVRFLLDHGVSPNYTGANTEETMLGFACVHGHAPIVELLLDRGATTDLRFPHGHDALAKAAIAGHVNVMEVLLKRGMDAKRIYVPGKGLMSLYAARHNDVRGLRLLHKYGALVDHREVTCGGTALISAAMANREIAVRWLLDHGANINARDPLTGNTALIAATTSGAYAAASELLRRKADVNVASYLLITALMIAVIHGREGLVTMLCMMGADVNARDHRGNTALSISVQPDRMDIMRTLLLFGADTTTLFYGDETLLHWAIREGNAPSVQLLAEHGAIVNDGLNTRDASLICAIGKKSVEIVRILLQNGACPNTTTTCPLRRPALAMAAQGGHKEIAKALLIHGADVDGRDVRGQTALMRAAWHNHPKIVKLLLVYKASVDAMSNTGRTALMQAELTNHDCIRKMLMDHGAQIFPVPNLTDSVDA